MQKLPRGVHSVNLMARLYHECRLLGVDLELEFRTAVGPLDGVIIRRSRAYAIIEAKPTNPIYESKQIKRYKTLGLPVHVLHSYDQCELMAAHFVQIVRGDGVIDCEDLRSGKFELPDDHPLKKRKKTLEEKYPDLAFRRSVR